MQRFLAILALVTSTTAARADIITFENLGLAPNSYENGVNLAGSFSSGGATFNNSYNSTYDVWSGWAYSNVVDNTTAGYGNQYAAFSPTGGDHSATYAVAYAGSPGAATIDFGVHRPLSLSVTNTTYAALSMRDGDQFAKKFGGVSGSDPDFFLLTITGLNSSGQSTGLVNFYLADYRSTNDFIVSDWTQVDLSSLGADTTKLSFGLSSSDNGAFGMNTPAYFAVDNLVASPEPSSFVLTTLGVAGMMGWVRRRRRQASGACPDRIHRQG